MSHFQNRMEAGRKLAKRLAAYRGLDDLVVLALPRGGVPVAFEIAEALAAPLDLCLVRKLGLPGHEELAFGAIASGGIRVINDEIAAAAGLTAEEVDLVVNREALELARRERLYRGNQPGFNPAGKTIILVDDGLATGATMRAALTSLLAAHPRRIIVALPVAASESCRDLARFDPSVSLIALLTPEDLQAVGLWYDDFSPVEDDEVIRLLTLQRSR